MSGEAPSRRPDGTSQVVPFSGPVVDLATIERIQTYQVMEHELDILDTQTSAENQALGFFTSMASIFVSLLATLLTAFPTNRYIADAMVLFAGASFVASLWFYRVWRFAKASRTTLLARIRGRTRSGQGQTP